MQKAVAFSALVKSVDISLYFLEKAVFSAAFFFRYPFWIVKRSAGELLKANSGKVTIQSKQLVIRKIKANNVLYHWDNHLSILSLFMML